MITQFHWAVGAFFIVVGLILTAGTAMPLFKRGAGVPPPFRGALIALEFVGTPEAVRQIIKSNLPATLRPKIDQDQRMIIPAYVILFSAMAVLIFWCAPARMPLGVRVSGIVFSLCLVGIGAGFDVRENLKIYETLDSFDASGNQLVPDAQLQPTLDALRAATIIKWTTLFAVFAVVAAPILMRGGWGAGVGLFFAVVGLGGLLALLPPLRGWVEYAFAGMGVALILAGLWFLFPPDQT